ncbi:UNVERIFIED_CONTAM: hypothetical protein Sradi_3014700 [Sesamum radiatum]|uniref:BED-type domain-containing protein n=1 Tax=Sesamum radiatum TaxID=300843 RepID=A0AAW2S1B0_SESRA
MSETSNRKDPGWNYASLPDSNSTNCVKCNFCGKVHKGAITGHKQHLAGGFRNFKSCPKCPENVRTEIGEYLETQQRDVAHGKRPSDVSLGGSSESVAQRMQQKKPRSIGPIDLYFMQDADEVVKQRKNKDGGKFDENRKKMREYVVQKFCGWMYDTGIPFNTVRADSSRPAIEALGQFGPNMKSPQLS